MRIIQKNSDKITLYINGEHKDIANNKLNQKLYPCTNKEIIDKIKSKYDLEYIKNIVHVQLLRRWSLACARSVLHYYEDVMKKDDLRNILNDVEKIIIDRENGIFNVEVARSAASSAAWSAESARSAESAARSASKSAARSAAWSAESAESAARSAAWSAARSAESAESAARSAAWSAESAESAAWSAARSARSEQEQKNLNLLIETLEGTL